MPSMRAISMPSLTWSMRTLFQERSIHSVVQPGSISTAPTPMTSDTGT